MKSFIEKCLGIDVEIEKMNTNDKLPMLYNSLYDFQKVYMKNAEWVVAVPKEQINLSQIRRHHRQMEKLLNMHCAIYYKGTSNYSKNTMISDGIPFIIEDREIYLPFIGVLLNTEAERELKPVQRISFLTQKMLIQAIYEKWYEINATKAAARLGITRMSASRCFDEMDFLDMPVLALKGKSRVINIQEDRKALWYDIKKSLRNPVISVFLMAEDLKLPIRGGITALSNYSMLEDNSYSTYIVSKKDVGNLKLKEHKTSPKGETPGCLVQEVGYIVPFGKGKNIDPLSLSLSLSDEDMSDERVEKSVREMLEEYVW